MSFWEGSLWQQRYEEQQRLDNVRLEQLRFVNPSLCTSDLRLLLEREKKEKQPVVRCCVCQLSRREYVRIKDRLDLCECPCHNSINS